MEKTQLISARISKKTLEKIDKWCKDNRYYKRNSVINGILSAVIDNAESLDLKNMIWWDDRFYEATPIIFQLKKK